MAASADPTKVSPKVRAVGMNTLLLSALLAVVGALGSWAAGVTPDQLPQLGIWAVPLITLATGLLNTLAGYLKDDPLRHDNALKQTTPLATLTPAETVYVKPPRLTEAEQAAQDARFNGNAG